MRSMNLILPLVFSALSLAGGQALGAPTVSVPDFKNEVANIPWWSASVSTQLADALANELAATGVQFVERQHVQEVLSEQELAEFGIVRPSEESAQSGQMTGAQYLILGRVNAYEAEVEEKAKGESTSFLGFGSTQAAYEAKAYIAIDLRVVDTTTGVVVGSRTVEGTAKDTAEVEARGGSLAPLAGLIGSATNATGGGAIALGVIGSFSQSEVSAEKKQTPVGKAIRAALIEASNYVDCVLVRQDRCLTEYAVKDAERRQRTLDVLELN
ncbi:MAG: penicillin-binding protein activator LpoB [Synechococcus sp. SB0666_bin_14]|nr:penicillin-binding protein activator LpoB [Synechococcus sp. SB0666_bin_14]MYA90219.1 penicillin-binding protein activator LpoB [Synechococcus sp. SB0663_bin_10]MYG47531.1 penicillin-binding protein activator LpoB [Synechococcus sp. SB0675_bin_6]MYJ59624.1 penicillin-binding protein activator LpoB [Synechococcus sp. SB0672_bin_6]MYK91669.1 penicillin-binding protein activator LpoB [Synechococcus sp. SB0669_bin_8]